MTTSGRTGTRERQRAWPVLVATAVVAAGLSACVPVAPTPAPPPPPQIFPSDTQTVPDASQLTGKRVNLPKPDCSVRPSDCDEFTLLNQLDGFDLDPAIAIRFSGPIDVAKVTDTSITVAPANG